MIARVNEIRAPTIPSGTQAGKSSAWFLNWSFDAFAN